jgi:hypothetical protein
MRDMNLRAQRLCVWCGPFMIVVWATSFAFLSRMIPPPDPKHTPAQVVHLFSQHTTAIQIGLVISLFACALLVPYGAVIAAQMRKIEGGRSVLAETQLVSCGLLGVEFLIPFAIWQTALYRIHEWDPKTVQMLNDMSWLMFLGIISSACIQVASLGICILRDKRAEPVFPRWLGYFNLWTAILWIPAGTIPLFKAGPFAWNGIMAWWVPLSVYFIWFVLMTVYLLRAIKQDEREQMRALAAAASNAGVPAVPAGSG